jgi:PAS domain S-box-containing protein
MSLRTRLRIAIVTLAALIVIAISVLYLLDFAHAALQNTSDRTQLIADEVKGYVLDRFDQVLREQPVQPASLEEYKAAWKNIVKTDTAIASMLQRTRASAYTVGNVAIAGEDGIILAASDPSTVGSKAPSTAEMDVVQGNVWDEGLAELFHLRKGFAFVLPLGVPNQPQPIFTIAVVIDSIFLRHALRPAFVNLGYAFAGALAVSMFLAFWLPNLVLRPLERVSRKIDLIRAGEFSQAGSLEKKESREFAAVQSKLNLLGQQIRGAREDALTMRGNIDRLMEGLGETVLLFDAQGTLTAASQTVEQIFGCKPKDMLGSSLDKLFPASTALGKVIRESLETRHTVQDRLLEREGAPAPRILVNVEPIENSSAAGAGILLRIRDAESQDQLEQHLDLASRLTAITRLTGGVAHEIKNPLNAIALHLEVLKTKLDGSQPEIGVIAREIQRLNRVVKTFLDFNRPVEIQVQEFDLAELAAGVARFLEPQAAAKNARIETKLDEKLWVRGDPELLRQGILNVMVNGLEAAGNGGALSVRGSRNGNRCEVEVSDNGPGIPAEIQQKIFNLYFTTKEKGSGIGLAMTFRLVQLQGGSIDVSSEPGHGATFRIQFPAAPQRPSSGATLE